MNIGFALEYSLGHITHAQNLKETLKNDPSVTPTYVDLPYAGMPGLWPRLPGFRSNWSARASMGAYLGLRKHARTLDAALFHTQVTSLFAAGLMRKLPSVISLDATPIQYDALGVAYGHVPSENERLEALKKRLNVKAFMAARHLVTWSQWAKNSLAADYGVPKDKVTVIPPGIDTQRWDFGPRSKKKDGPVNLLFVGADFSRKGGPSLMEAFQKLPSNLSAHLHIVTKTEGVGEEAAHVTVHRGITPNSSELLRLYAEADVFVFPTLADCLPLAVMEALAAGLPVVTTDVAALPEAVTQDETGLIVPTRDSQALADALRLLIADPEMRLRMGCQARKTALLQFNAADNYRRLVQTMKDIHGKTV